MSLLRMSFPKLAIRKKLIDLSLKNVLYLKAKKEISKEETKIKNIEVLKGLEKDLQLKNCRASLSVLITLTLEEPIRLLPW